VTLALRATGPGPTALGRDPVLLEWALEAVIKTRSTRSQGAAGGSTWRSMRPRRTARLSVRDDGPGVPPKCGPSCSSPAYRPSRADGAIGLALARRIVEQQHGGRLAYRPAPTGEGPSSCSNPTREHHVTSR